MGELVLTPPKGVRYFRSSEDSAQILGIWLR